MSRSAELVDLALMVHHETKAAWLVSDDGVEKNACWVPKSQVEVEPGPRPRGHVDGGQYEATVTMPEWLAIEKGFV